MINIFLSSLQGKTETWVEEEEEVDDKKKNKFLSEFESFKRRIENDSNESREKTDDFKGKKPTAPKPPSDDAVSVSSEQSSSSSNAEVNLGLYFKLFFIQKRLISLLVHKVPKRIAEKSQQLPRQTWRQASGAGQIGKKSPMKIIFAAPENILISCASSRRAGPSSCWSPASCSTGRTASTARTSTAAGPGEL